VSASDSGRCWELRCFVREGMLEYLRRELPECLPHRRIRMSPGN
jgi:hypothetical protein